MEGRQGRWRSEGCACEALCVEDVTRRCLMRPDCERRGDEGNCLSSVLSSVVLSVHPKPQTPSVSHSECTSGIKELLFGPGLSCLVRFLSTTQALCGGRRDCDDCEDGWASTKASMKTECICRERERKEICTGSTKLIGPHCALLTTCEYRALLTALITHR